MTKVFFAGVMVDSLGVNLCCLVFSGLYLAGNLITLGESYMCLLVGRLVYGLGTECVSVVQDTLLARWYSHDTKVTLSMALAVCMLSFRLSSFLSMTATPNIYALWGFEMVLLITAAFVAGSFASAVALVLVDNKYKEYLKTPLAEQFHWKDITNLPSLFWMLVLTAFGTYGAVLPFISFASEMIQQKWHVSDIEAAHITASLYLSAAFVMVPLGFLIDRYGHRMIITFVACVTPLLAYSLLLCTRLNPVIGCLLLGTTHGLLPAAIFPSIALIVPPRLIGTAYGIITSAVNSALFLSPFLLGLIADWADTLALNISLDGISPVSLLRVIFLVCFSLLGTLGSIVGWIQDTRTGGLLERTCVLKLGAKVSEDVLRQSQMLHESQKLTI
jgi:MFS family permease